MQTAISNDKNVVSAYFAIENLTSVKTAFSNKVSSELDEIQDAARNGKQWIARLQETERDRTGISTLKVNYNKVFGYYIEVSKANLGAVPEDYIRKQTLVNAERFITPELKEMESKVLGAEEKLSNLEYEIFIELRKEIAQECERIQKAAESIATLDVFISMAKIAAPIGVRKMAESPAAIPINTSSRRSSSARLRTVAYKEPMPDAINAVGPSRPAAPPEPMVIADATIFSRGTRPRMTPPAR